MSQIYFSKVDSEEKINRLSKLPGAKAVLTIWTKGEKFRSTCTAILYSQFNHSVIVDYPNNPYPQNTELLCSFELRGISFFAKVRYRISADKKTELIFDGDLFKSERRSSYRLLTYPIYDVWAEFDLGEVYEGGKVIDIKSKISQTNLFKNFLKIVDPNRGADTLIKTVKLRVQDLSTTGMAIHVGDVESPFFPKDFSYKKVSIIFLDETIQIPEIKVVYKVDYIGNDKYASKYKVGLHFTKIDSNVDSKLGAKINSLLREIDFNLDFENFIK